MNDRLKSGALKMLYCAIAAVSLYLFLHYAVDLLLPFAIALFVAALLRRPARALAAVTPLSSRVWSMIGVALSFFGVAAILYFGIRLAVHELTQLCRELPEIYVQKIEPAFQGLFARIWALSEKDAALADALRILLEKGELALSEMIQSFSGKMAAVAGKWVLRLPSLLLCVSVTVVATFFICADYDAILSFLSAQCSPRVKKTLGQLQTLLIGSIFKMIKAYLLLFGLTFLELWAGLLLMQVPHAAGCALLIAFADILPLIGTGTVLIPWAITAIFYHRIPFAVGLIALYLIITLVRNLVEPRLIGQKLGLHPVVTLIAIYAGLRIGGPLWAMLLPFLIIVVQHLNDSGILHLYKKPYKSMRKKETI